MVDAMKIAITGARGFIGRHILAELANYPIGIIRYPIEVIATTRDKSKLKDVAENVQVVELDIANPQPDDYERLHEPDVLIHLAWENLLDYKSLHHFEVEMPRQYQFLKGLITTGLPSLVVAGTCFEYGMQPGMLSEEMIPLPTNPYGYAKDALRQQLEFLRGKRPFALTWTRPFYIYGDEQSGGSIYSQLKEAVTQGKTEFNMSGGEQLRDYLPVNEVANILVSLAVRQKNFGVVNVCSGKPRSIRNLVEGWLKENNWNINLKLGHYNYSDYEAMAFWGCRLKLNTILEGHETQRII